jgi:hypothetical protein|tara:strand:- start:824 stop:1378 length:555 start_codon:yes stop_codon:yes gene_type:complete
VDLPVNVVKHADFNARVVTYLCSQLPRARDLVATVVRIMGGRSWHVYGVQARGQAGQVAMTLDWRAEGLEEPMQKVREGNAGGMRALETVSGQLQRLAKEPATRSDCWNAANDELQAALNASLEDSLAGELEQRSRYFKVLDDLVIAADVLQGADERAPGRCGRYFTRPWLHSPELRHTWGLFH